MQTVSEMLKAKGKEVWTIGPDATVYEALEVMAQRDVGALVVVQDGRPVGIFSERDYARKVILKGKSSKETPVRDLMTEDLLCVSPSSTVEECMALMSARKLRHLPVVDGGRLAGIISIGDVVNEVITNQDFKINEMEKYILTGH